MVKTRREIVKLKVLVTLNDMCIGGSQAYVVTLINEMKARGHTIFVASGRGEMVRDLEKKGAKHYEGGERGIRKFYYTRVMTGNKNV